MLYYLGILFCIVSVLHSTDAFCERMYKNPYWTPKSLSQRAVDADIVIYGNVIESPCVKPIFVAQNITAAPPTNATNSSSSAQPVTPNIQPVTNSSVNITQGNTTDICLMRGLYNVTIDVLCVIKGGSVPYKLHLRSFGFGPEKCVYYHRGYNYWEIVQSFHVYKGLNYLIFLGRHEGSSDSQGFWPHDVNMQYSATEIMDEKFLQPVFEATGGHASPPGGANETHSICTPFIAGAGTHHVTFLFVVVLLLVSELLLI